MKEYGFGVDIGGTTVKMGLFRTNGELLDKWEIPTRTQNGGELILSDVAAAIDAKLAEKSIKKEEVQGVGIGVPGPVQPDGTVACCVNLGWGIFNVEEKFNQLTGLRVRAGNDANVAALGEMWQGAGKGVDNVVMITLGTGVGGGVIVDGKMVAGSTGAGGEIGHMPVRDDEVETCGCGNHGCLEQYTSATGVVRLAKRKLLATAAPTPLRDLENLEAKDVFDQAKAGDAVAIEIVEEFGQILGRAMAVLSCVVNPEVFVIGGGVSKAGQIVLDSVAPSYKKHAFHACRSAQMKLAQLGNDAGIYGCVKMLL